MNYNMYMWVVIGMVHVKSVVLYVWSREYFESDVNVDLMHSTVTSICSLDMLHVHITDCAVTCT